MISQTVKEQRVKELKEMNRAILNLGDEDIWLEWIELGVPDCPRENDYGYIAEDNISYFETVQLFKALMEIAR